MRNNPLVSVIVPIYKTEKYLYRCIESIRNQSYSNLDIILVDDGSPDKCPELCDNFALSDSRIRVIHKENGGVFSARNAGLDIMIGNYVTFVNSNDFIYRDYIKSLVFLCLKYNTEIAACKVRYGRGSNFKHVSKSGKIYVYKKTDAFMSRKIKFGTAGKLYKTTLFVSERFPVGEQLNDDEAFTYKLIYKSNQIALTDKKLYYCYQIKTRNKEQYASADFVNAFDNRIRFFESREIDLLDLSWENYCLNLIHFYKNCKTDSARNEILSRYKKAYKKVMQNQITPISYKIMFSAFNLAPSKCAFAVNKLHKR